MSFTSTFDLTTFVKRGVEILLEDIVLRNKISPELSLVSTIIEQEPPIDQSPNNAIMPVIFVAPSKNPIRDVENFGRSTRDLAGGKYYHLEFYNVCVARGISRQQAQIKVQNIARQVRDSYQKNLRMIKPTDQTDPICAINDVVSVPYVLKSKDPNIQAINVIVRPKVPINLRG